MSGTIEQQLAYINHLKSLVKISGRDAGRAYGIQVNDLLAFIDKGLAVYDSEGNPVKESIGELAERYSQRRAYEIQTQASQRGTIYGGNNRAIMARHNMRQAILKENDNAVATVLQGLYFVNAELQAHIKAAYPAANAVPQKRGPKVQTQERQDTRRGFFSPSFLEEITREKASKKAAREKLRDTMAKEGRHFVADEFDLCWKEHKGTHAA